MGGKGRNWWKTSRLTDARSKAKKVISITTKLSIPVVFFMCLIAIRNTPMHSGDSLPTPYDPFKLYPGEEHIIFQENILGLQDFLKQAIMSGCGHFQPNESVHIIFTSDLAPKYDRYIQIQMEQMESPVWGEDYIKKLQDAEQVWFFSPFIQGIAKYRHKINNSFYVPLFLARPPKVNATMCKSHVELPVGSGVTVFWIDTYFQSVQIGQSFVYNNNSNDIMEHFDVFYFATMKGSYQNRREQLCAKLQNAGIRILCAFGYGQELQALLCKSKIVLVDAYYKDAALAVHRIDPLLDQEKVVIAIDSYDVFLNMQYSKVVRFATFDNVVEVVDDTLAHFPDISKRLKSNIATFIEAMSDPWPLCYAIQHLEKNMHS